MFHPSSNASSTTNSYHSPAIGTVAACHSACASSTRKTGGKSNNSSAIAAIVNATHTAAFVAHLGL